MDTEGRRIGLLVPGHEAQRALIERTFLVPVSCFLFFLSFLLVCVTYTLCV
jgi:hypothetical protein